MRYTYILVQGLKKVKNRLWKLFDSFNDDSIRILSTKDIIKKYFELNVDDIEEFAASYTYSWHFRHKRLDDRSSKIEMYTEVHEILLRLEEQGLLKK